MKKYGVTGLLLAMVLGGLISTASAAPYLSGDFGYVMARDAQVSGSGGSDEISFDPGYGFLAAVGNGFDFVRGEVELGYRTNDLDKDASGAALTGDISSMSVMANLLADLDVSPYIKPFIGAGVGMARVEVNDTDDDNDTVFAYQGIVGVGFPLTNVTTLDFSYRYFATADPNFSGTDVEYKTHNGFVGLRFDF